MNTKRLLRDDTFIGLALALGTFAVYLSTLSPSIGLEDPGELAAAAHTLGVAHPTGYPLFTLLGRAFSILPLGDLRVIVKLNLMGAVFCAVAAFVFYRLFLVLLRDNFSGGGKNRAPAETPPVHRLAAAAGTFGFAFSRVYWANAVSVEVYALHLLFLALVTLLFALSVRERTEGDSGGGRLWLLFSYVLGLSFANHMMTVLLAPAFLYLYFAAHGFGAPAWRKIGAAVPSFLLGLTLYLYLPIRAALKPLMNWGDPSTPDAFWRHISAGQYRSMMFSSADVAQAKVGQFFTALPRDFGYMPLLLALFGLWFLFRRSRRMTAFSLLLFFTCLISAVNYDFEDPNFRLNAHFAVALWIAHGARGLAERVGRGAQERAAAVLCAAAALFSVGANYRAADQSANYAVEDFARNVLGSVDSQAVILTGAYHVFGAPAFYLQLVENARPDVIVIQTTLLESAWYRGHLEARDPRVTANSRQAFEDVYRAVAAAKGLPRGNEGGQLVWSLIRGNHATRPVHVTADLEPEKSRAAVHGMTFRYFPDSVRPPPFDGPEPEFRPIEKSNEHTDNIKISYAVMYANHGLLRVAAGDTVAGIALLRRALDLRPDYTEIRTTLRALEGNP